MAACKWVNVSASGISAKSSSMAQLEFCSTTTEDCLLSELAFGTNGQLIFFQLSILTCRIVQLYCNKTETNCILINPIFHRRNMMCLCSVNIKVNTTLEPTLEPLESLNIMQYFVIYLNINS